MVFDTRPVALPRGSCWLLYSAPFGWRSSLLPGQISRRSRPPSSAGTPSPRSWLCISGGFPPSPDFSLYTHLFRSALFPFGNSTNSYVWFSCRESISSCMALNHFRLWVSSLASSKLSGSPSSVPAPRFLLRPNQIRDLGRFRFQLPLLLLPVQHPLPNRQVPRVSTDSQSVWDEFLRSSLSSSPTPSLQGSCPP